MNTLLVTGGAGFIGSNFIRYMLENRNDINIINLDKLTYAGNLDNLKDIENDERYQFVKGDICNPEVVRECIKKSNIVINFAAESHVDRSIGSADDFIKTDVYGVYVLLEAAKEFGIERFVQISTDEVYGSIDKGYFKETDALMPSSPYAASKAGGDRLVYSYYVTYNMSVVIPRSSNNFGPYQYPEKLIPLFITNALEDKELPIYGDGKNVRDWLYVTDNCQAIELIMENGKDGEAYNIGAGNEKNNLEITDIILKKLDKSKDLMTFVKDRKGHDRRYALDTQRLSRLGWKPAASFKNAMQKTIQWYIENRWWWEKIKSGEYMEYYKKQYRQD